ncbi:uncharacterized protein LOC125149895 [Prionailurus viverrinus]|uniref:uncharacterized protein LOC125149895 n=1 Tax=Prionailurus viverrinus TaxID=61388 RepID=UPI001FF6833A|nr:uncharacterized protein LOC125149895 [Prionailurus viverrinus]
MEFARRGAGAVVPWRWASRARLLAKRHPGSASAEEILPVVGGGASPQFSARALGHLLAAVAHVTGHGQPPARLRKLRSPCTCCASAPARLLSRLRSAWSRVVCPASSAILRPPCIVSLDGSSFSASGEREAAWKSPRPAASPGHFTLAHRLPSSPFALLELCRLITRSTTTAVRSRMSRQNLRLPAPEPHFRTSPAGQPTALPGPAGETLRWPPAGRPCPSRAS